MLPLIFAPEDVVQRDQIIEQGIIIISPPLITFRLRLNAPAFPKFLRTHLALLAIFGRGFPNVCVPVHELCGAKKCFAENTGSLKEVAKIIAYFVGVVLLGAVLAPPLYWAGNALAAGGTLTFLGEVPFQRYFNRAILIAAVLLLWPTVRSLKIGGWRELGLQPDPRWRSHALIGFAIGGALVAIMAALYVPLGFYRWRSDLPWEKLPAVAMSAFVVAIIEEALFRGAIFGLFRRSLRPVTALFWVTALFAILHFLKPDEDFKIAQVGWMSGFVLLPHSFHQFAEPMTLLAGFTTLFTLGWVLGLATMRTRALWMSIGLHAGVVFVKMGFSKFARRDHVLLPWVGPELQIGLVPVAVLAFGGVLVWILTRHEAAATRD